jgi:tetratricopeptide (TPR) repeat protein
MEPSSHQETAVIEESAGTEQKIESPDLEKKRLDAQNLSTIGTQLQGQKKIVEAFEYYSRSKSAFEKIGDKKGTALQLKHMAFMKETLGEFPPSLQYYGESKALFKDLGDKEELGEVADRIAKTLYKDRKFEEAIKEYQEALDFGCEGGDIYNNLGFVQISAQRSEEAMPHLRKARDIRAAENNEFLDITLNNLGAVAFLQKSYKEASEYFTLALEANKRKPKDDRTIEYIVFANEAYLREGILHFECYNDVLTKSAEHLNLAATWAVLGDREKSLSHCEEAQSLDPDKPYICLPSAWIYLTIGNTAKALQYFKRVLTYVPGNAPLKEIVEKINPYAFEKIGRNEPCPCNSGKKFKKCHGAEL